MGPAELQIAVHSYIFDSFANIKASNIKNLSNLVPLETIYGLNVLHSAYLLSKLLPCLSVAF